MQYNKKQLNYEPFTFYVLAYKYKNQPRQLKHNIYTVSYIHTYTQIPYIHLIQKHTHTFMFTNTHVLHTFVCKDKHYYVILKYFINYEYFCKQNNCLHYN